MSFPDELSSIEETIDIRETIRYYSGKSDQDPNPEDPELCVLAATPFCVTVSR